MSIIFIFRKFYFSLKAVINDHPNLSVDNHRQTSGMFWMHKISITMLNDYLKPKNIALKRELVKEKFVQTSPI